MIKRLVLRGINTLGVPAALRQLNRSRIAILMYHGFSAHQGKDQPDFEALHLDVDSFRNHLRFLTKHYSVVPLDAVAAAIRGEAALPDRAAVISIDDGYRSVANLALPVLEEFGTPASVFLCTDFIDGQPLWNDRIEHAMTHSRAEQVQVDIAGRSHAFDLRRQGELRRSVVTLIDAIKRVPHEARDSYVEELERMTGARLTFDRNTHADYLPMSWEDVRTVAASNLISIGSHTKSHAILSQCRTETIRTELTTSRRFIEDQVGRPCTLFCYPNGETGDFDERTRAALVEAGFVCGLTTVSGLNDLQGDVMALRRYFTQADVTALAVRMSGLHELRRSRSLSIN
ncbi:MAG: polysaccharide deacetylase family protein [Planctomycetota bacterium]|jgi:peptidoglycan/xylan/chitin deacetylase (PgdA/CDA1 family)